MKTPNILCGLMLTLAAAFPFHSEAGTLFYVPIPATNSDAQAGIAPANGYSSAIDAGNTKGTERTVNGVRFGALTGTGNTRTANGVTLSAATGTLTNGGGKSESIQADGAVADLLTGMIFNDGASDNSEQYAVLDPVTLTAGKTYDLRVYVCNASGENRQVSLSFAGDGKAAVSTDFFNEDDATTSAGGFIEPNQVYYINYRFTWDGVSTPGFTATQKFGSTPFCLYALTNQEVGGEAEARPVGAIVALQPERVSTSQTSRSTRTSYVETDEDIGVSSDVFYSARSLREHGRWVTVGTYGRCWQPTDVDADWQPYTRGRWVHSADDGWVWDSDEDFGWATYHYGRWFREEDSGWYWVPGKVWAPAWVSWRHGHSYVGWAPLPPMAMAAAGVGISSWADHRWGIGPRAYNFVNVRDFGARSMARVLIPREQNPGIMTNTNNVTNIVNNRRGIYNGGPNFQAVNNALGRTGSPLVPSVQIDRNPGTQPVTPDGKFSQLTAGILAMTAPTVTRNKKPGSLPPIAATIATPKFDKGWAGLPDPKNAAALQAKIANETPGTAAKSAPANLPGAIPSAPGGSNTKTTPPLKPFRQPQPVTKPGQPAQPTDAPFTKPGQPAKPTDAPFTKPGQPAQPTDAPFTKPGQPTQPTDAPFTKPGQPAKPTDAPFTKPGQPAQPTDAPFTKPGQPAKPTDAPFTKPGQPAKQTDPLPPQPGQPVSPPADGMKKRGKGPRPATETVPQSGQPTKPVEAPVIKPGQPVNPSNPGTPTPEPIRPKKRTPQPDAPISPPVVKPPVPAIPTPEPIRPNKRISQPDAPVSPPINKPAAPTIPAPESARPMKRTPQPAPAIPAPVKVATPVPAVPKPAPVERPNPRPAPPIVAPVKPVAPPPAPVARPTPIPAPPVRPAPPVVMPVKPAPPAAPPASTPPPKKGEKPTPTPAPGVNG